MRYRLRVLTLGKLLVLIGALATTFVVFAAIAMRVAVRALEVPVPALVGQGIDEARRAASDLGLVLRVDEGRRPDPKVPAGQILGQDPVPGARARRQRSIRVWVSSGPRIVVAPALVGDTHRAAQIRLTQDGMTMATVSEVRDRDYPPDVVIAQDPPAGARTAEVRLLVNRGEDRVGYVMPDLIGVDAQRAAELLRARGFRISVVAQQASPGLPPGIVIRQQPSGGYQVHPGDAISLEVSQ